MAIQQSKRQSDLEKRLQILRRQVYGKSPDRSENLSVSKSGSQNSGTLKYQSSDIPTSSGALHTESFRSDLAYLRQDLLKILILASFAIGAQIFFFIFSKNHILNLNFY